MRSLRLLRHVSTFAVFASLATAPAIGRAQSGTAKVAAETLFEEGRRLVADGKAVEACPKFAESQRLDPSPSTLLNLASCYEKTDRPATAWATYKEAASAATALGRQDFVATAQRHADALMPMLARLNLTVTTPVDGIVVKLDGVEVGRPQWGLALPVDPGEHTLDASAPQYKPWTGKIAIGKDAATTPAVVPALEPAPAPPPPPVAPLTGPAPQPTEPAAPPPDRGRPQRTVGLLVGAGGVVGLGLTGVFAAVAKGKYSDSLANCGGPTAPNACSHLGVEQRNSARSMGDAASVALGIGSVALVTGVVLWLTAPSPGAPDKPQSAKIEVTPTLGGAMVSGRW